MWFNSQKLFVGSTPLPLHNSSCKVPYTLLQNSCREKNSNLFGDCYFYTHKKISNKYMQMFYMGKIHFSG